MQRPDYAGDGFLNLIATLVAARGGEPRHATLAALPPAGISGATNVVFLIIDGLGDQFLLERGGGSALLAARRQSISAVFPPTTATAITTSYTGLSPAEHGLTGWFTYFSQAACVAAPLPFKPRGGANGLRERGIAPAQLFRGAPLLDALDTRAIVVSWDAIMDSDYNRHHCGGAERHAYAKLEGLVDGVEAAVKSGPGRKFVYAYWWQLDAIEHRHGAGSPEALAHFGLVDAAFRDMQSRLAGTDTLIVATADHGFMDSAGHEQLLLEDAPGLCELLRFPLCGEPRMAWCHVQPGRVREFIDRARSWLGDRAEVRASSELLDEGWFGPGEAHPQLRERIGDVALVMRGRHTIKDRVAGETRHVHIGNHGGTSAAEMRIPLIMAST